MTDGFGPAIWRYRMMPFGEHVDGGLGATGEAFEDAANALRTANHTEPNAHLPINFLYRHAIELFLKSMIVVLHRCLEISYGPHRFDGEPYLPDNGKWKPMRTTHSLGKLLQRLVELVHAHGTELDARCRTDWRTFPPELFVWIREIDAADSGGTCFRYPDGRDANAEAAKSTWKPTSESAMLERIAANPGAGAMIALFFEGDADEPYLMSCADRAPLLALAESLVSAATHLSGCMSGLRVELAGSR